MTHTQHTIEYQTFRLTLRELVGCDDTGCDCSLHTCVHRYTFSYRLFRDSDGCGFFDYRVTCSTLDPDLTDPIETVYESGISALIEAPIGLVRYWLIKAREHAIGTSEAERIEHLQKTWDACIIDLVLDHIPLALWDDPTTSAKFQNRL